MNDDPPNLIRLADKRPSVFYELMIEHRWDGEISIWTKGIADDYKSIRAIAVALRKIADRWDAENPEPINAPP